MEKNKLKPVFYDARKKRWPRVKYGSLTLFFTLFLVFGVFILSLFMDAFLKHIPLIPSLYHLNYVKSHAAANLNNNLPDDNTPLFASADQAWLPNPVEQELIGNRFKKMAFLPDRDVAALYSLRQNLSKLDVVFIGGGHLQTTTGDIVEEEPDNLAAIVNEIHHKPDTKAILVLDNSLIDKTSEFLANPVLRQKVIQYELKFLKRNGFDGINISFENLSAENRNDLSLFVQELFHALHPQNLSVSVNVYSNNLAYDYQNLANNADYIVLAAFDEHWNTSEPGPLASTAWFRQQLTDTAKEIPAEKLVLSLANFGYDWKEKEKAARILTFSEVMALAKLSNAQITLDSATGNPFFKYQEDDNLLHQVWFLDAVTLFNQCVIADSVQPCGIALWRLGSEDPSVWAVLDNEAFNKSTAFKLGEIDPKNSLSLIGQPEGDIFAIHHGSQLGEREIVFDYTTGLISHETYKKIPVAYVFEGYTGKDRKQVALTFDDGPHAKYTTQILDILKATNTPATFFLIGRNILNNRELVRREIAEGHDIGNHTYTHPDISRISETTLTMELASTKRLLETTTGRSTLLFRAPYGINGTPRDLKDVKPIATVTKNGYYTVGMRIDPQDWSKPGTDVIVQRVIDQVHKGEYYKGESNVVLLHDGGGSRQQTVEALPKIIAALTSEGYKFVSISQLMNLDRDVVMPKQASSWYLSLSGISFKLLQIGSYFIPIIYILGLAIVMMRFFVLTSLSVYQKIRASSQKEESVDEDLFSLAVVVPAYNESASIVGTINSLLTAKHPARYEIIVVNDGSTDNTLEILQKHFDNHPIVKIVNQQNAGKGAALNNGINHTTADLVTILDADTLVEPDTLIQLMRPLYDPRVGAAAGNIRVANQTNLMTKWQVLEYATGQSLDRRALSVLDAVVVVPGALGCWRRSALLEAGGFTTDTLAEDADMTLKLKRLGLRIAVAEGAHAYTEVPESVREFLRQRFRWMYGTYQVVWKHLGAFFRPRYGTLGFIALPNLFLVHVILPLIAPLTDLLFVLVLLSFLFNACFGYTFTVDDMSYLKSIVFYYALFTGLDLLTTLLAFMLDSKEKKSYLFWLIPQRFFYKQLIYFVAFQSVIAALHGREVWWGRMTRKQTVEVNSETI